MNRKIVKHLIIIGISIVFPVILSIIHSAGAVSHHGHIQNLLTFILILLLAGEMLCLFIEHVRKIGPAAFFRSLFSSYSSEKRTGKSFQDADLSGRGASRANVSDNFSGRSASRGRARSRGREGFLSKYGTRLSICLCAVILMSFFCIQTTYKFDKTSDIFGQTKVRSVESGNCLEQVIRGHEIEKLSAVNIKFNTYERDNEGTVTVELRENGIPVQSWTILSASIKNKAYRTFELDSLLDLNENSEYLLHVEEQYEGENDIGLCIAGDQGEGYVINGDTKDHGTLCYTLTYRNTALKGRFTRIGLLFGILAAILLLLGINETAMMAYVLAVLMIAFTSICPPFMAPDEVNHFRRAFEIAEIGYVSEHMGETGVGGNVLPKAVNEYVSLFTEDEQTDEDEEPAILLNRDETDENEEPVILLNWDETEEMEYGNTALYSPISYLPQAVGIRIACVFTDNVAKIFFAGRLANAIACFLVCILAVCTVPFGKRVLFLIMTFPLSVQEMISMSPDGFTISLSLFFLALILKLSYGDSRIRSRDLVVTAVSAIILSQLKIVYVVLLLLLLMIPLKKFGSPRQAIMFKAALLGAAFLLNVIWLKISAGFLVEFNPGVDTPAQVSFILTHMGKYYGITASTLIARGNVWLATMVGQTMGAYSIGTAGIVWVTGLILLIYETLTCYEMKEKVRKWDPLLLIITFLLGCALVVTSLYVQWTPLQNNTIEGIQGRYFTPLIGLFAFFMIFTRQAKLNKSGVSMYLPEKRTFLYMLILFYNSVALMDIVKYYIAELW